MSWSGASRVCVVGAVMTVAATACGQVGGVHTVARAAPIAVTSPTPLTLGGEADSGASLVDAGGAVGPTLSGNSVLGTSTFGPAPIASPLPQTVLVPLAPPTPKITNPNGPLYVCPVQGPFSVGDDFGAPRYAGGYHPHAGNDMFAPENTPIVAPFPGTASADPNNLGGNAVVVQGKDGYVYNAHLASYGRLGPVQTGDVIGYVGNTGDAQGGPTHDHFEWHPYHPTINWVSSYGYSTVPSGDPPAVDPFPYLRAACS